MTVPTTAYDYKYASNKTIEQLNELGLAGYRPVGDLIRDSTGRTVRFSGLLVRELDLDAYRYDGPSGPYFVGRWDTFVGTTDLKGSWLVSSGGAARYPLDVQIPIERVDGDPWELVRKLGLCTAPREVRHKDDASNTLVGISVTLAFIVFADAERAAQRLAQGQATFDLRGDS